MSKSSKRPKKPKKPRKKTTSSHTHSKPQKRPERIDISLNELKAILESTKSGPLSDVDRAKLGGAVDTLAELTRELEAKGASVRRLRRLIFGPTSEKTRDVLGDRNSNGEGDSVAGTEDTASEIADGAEADAAAPGETVASDSSAQAPTEERKKRKGHGRNGAKDYKGAEKIAVPNENLKHKDRCPECLKGKLYILPEPAVLVRVKGMAPLAAVVYEMERLRCNLCGQVFTAAAPDGIGKEKYDETAAAMIGMFKYGCGMPFNRLERLETNLGIPLPASTQWEVVEPAATKLMPVYTEFIRQAAQGEVLHNDDTTARILDLQCAMKKGEKLDDGIDSSRTGIFTSGIVSVKDKRQIAMFFTGRKHAGENLADVLKHRAAQLDAPIQMSDGLAVNTAGDFESIPAECNSHARRRFIDVVDSYPDEVEFVLQIFKAVYKNDDLTKSKNMSNKERLEFHQKHSGPLMADLEIWCKEQFDEKKTEPNSNLGGAITYTQKHWKKLTLFLRKEGAPLDNNVCERALKKAILHRKNAMFFKTMNGAKVSDMFMSFIHTCELEKVNAFDYLVALLKNHDRIATAPERWMPWNYRETIALLESETRRSTDPFN